MKKILLILIIVVVSFFIFYHNTGSEFITIEINGIKIKAEVPENYSQGLSGRKFLPEQEGMIFIFEEPDYYSFWMKDMNFEIDIIWIDKNKKIVDLSKNISPETWPNYFQPEREVKYVLEVTGGFVKSNEIKVGERVSF